MATAKKTSKKTAKKAAKKAPAKKTAAAKKAPTKAVKARAKQVADKKIAAQPKSKKIKVIDDNYDPRKDKGAYMNETMLEYFRQQLVKWREDLIRESSETQENLRESQLQKPDLADRASAETDHALELRTRDRERKLVKKINSALRRIEEEEYGYCEETGDEIGVSRLMARPVATMTLEAQERHERNEKIHREE